MRYEVAGNGCWNWLGATDDGYGTIIINGKRIMAHRVSYQLFVGRILGRQSIHHTCHNRDCINPEHLQMLPTNSHAQLHSSNRRKETCKHGHPFDEANTYVGRDKKGRLYRRCRACHAQREREHQRTLRVRKL